MHRGTLRGRSRTGHALVLCLLLGFTLVGAAPAAGAAERLGSGPAVDAPRGLEGPIGGERLGSRGRVLPSGAEQPPQGLTAQAWLVADLDTGEVLAARDPHGLYAPASTLKTLTALTFLPRLDPDERLQPVWDDVAVEGSRVGLVESLTYPARELFDGLMLMSGNDAALVLARSAGDLDAGLALMNRTARSLGAYDTVARTPNGLDAEGQSSSAYDLALIARAALDREDFRRIVSTRCTDIAAPEGARIPICNKNKLLGSYDGAFGVKNGYTSSAGASFVGAAERDGRRLVVSLLAADPRVWEEAALLLDWGFALRPGLSVGQLVEPRGAGRASGSAPVGEADEATGGAAGTADAGERVGGEAEETRELAADGGVLPGGTLATLPLLLLSLVGGLRWRAVARQRRRRAERRRRADQRLRAELRALRRESELAVGVLPPASAPAPAPAPEAGTAHAAGGPTRPRPPVVDLRDDVVDLRDEVLEGIRAAARASGPSHASASMHLRRPRVAP